MPRILQVLFRSVDFCSLYKISTSVNLFENEPLIEFPCAFHGIGQRFLKLGNLLLKHSCFTLIFDTEVNRKLRVKIREKEIAMGHKPDDHEEQQNWGGMTMGM